MMESYHLIAIFPVGYPEEDAKPSHLHTTRKSEEEFMDLQNLWGTKLWGTTLGDR